jgi:hypothetical protein
MKPTMRRAFVLTVLVIGCGYAGGGCATPEPRGAVKTSKPNAAVRTQPVDCSEAGAPYLAELCAMGEPSLSVQGPETYRFLWMRHLHNPVAVRLTRAGNDIAVVTVESDVRDPAAKRRHEFVVDGAAWTTLRAHLDAADFWNLAGDPTDDERGLDGADWIIEGRRGGIYHSVVRWNPPPGPFRRACEDFIRISGLAFPTEIR